MATVPRSAGTECLYHGRKYWWMVLSKFLRRRRISETLGSCRAMLGVLDQLRVEEVGLG